jgi:hypothetical protein
MLRPEADNARGPRDAGRDAKWCQTALAEWLDEAGYLTSGAWS